MNQSKQNQLLLVTENTQCQETLTEQLKSLIPTDTEILPFSMDAEEKPALDGQYFVVFSGAEVCQKFMDMGLEAHIGQQIIGGRTAFSHRLDLILSLPRDEEILIMGSSKKEAEENIKCLRDIGLDFLNLLPAYPGAPLADRQWTAAVTMGNLVHISPAIDKVYDIGIKPFDFTTAAAIMSHYNLLNERLQPYANQYLNLLLQYAQRLSEAADEVSRVNQTVRTMLLGSGYFAKYHLDDIIGKSQVMQKVKDSAERIASTDLSILIEGENGTGKELLASAVHNASGRSHKPFVSINLSALPDYLIESELFGSEDGTFSGKTNEGKIGLFQQAEGGTIFLNEIGDISMKMQTKLLRVLKEREIMKVGGTKIIPIDVRIIAATSRNLSKMTEDRVFRKDLYYRLKEGHLHLPPLSQRREDIPLLVTHWMNTLFCSNKEISPLTMEALMRREWQGNIRELLNVMKFALAVSTKHILTPADLPYDGPESPAGKVPQLQLSKTDDVSMIILSAIREINQRGEIAGRNRIYWFLRDEGRNISEYKIRKCISMLSDQGLISATHGKYGLSLTDKGLMILETKEK